MQPLPRCLECNYVLLSTGVMTGKAVYYCDNSYCNRYGILVVNLVPEA